MSQTFHLVRNEWKAVPKGSDDPSQWWPNCRPLMIRCFNSRGDYKIGYKTKRYYTSV